MARKAQPSQLDDQTLDILAWDISDAFAKTIDDHGLDFGMDEIKAALPDFITAIKAHAQDS